MAIDTGGTKTLIASFDKEGNKNVINRIPTPRNKANYINEITKIIKDSVDQDSIEAISVALPGVIKHNIAEWCPNLKWESFDVIGALKNKFPETEIFIENDANLAGLGEVRSLAQMPATCLYITISTGIGSGIITDGRINPYFRLSEIGHIVVEFDGRIREWESFASGKAILEHYHKLAKDIHKKKIWTDICDRISRGLLTAIPLVQPDLVIIGGSVGIYFSRYEDALNYSVKSALPKKISMPKIVRAQHPDEAVIYGCYHHAIDKLKDK